MVKALTVLVVLAGAYIPYYRQTTDQGHASSQPTAKAKSSIDQDIKLLREDIRSRKKQLIVANLKLTADARSGPCMTNTPPNSQRSAISRLL